MAFVNVELINILLQFIPEQKWRDVGQKLGEAARISMEATLNLEASNQESWPDVLKRLRVQGFGDFYVRDKYLVIKAPFVNNYEVLCGFLESLFDIRMEPRTMNPPFVFEVITKVSSGDKTK